MFLCVCFSVKAGVRALDTMNDLTMKKKGVGVDRFLVAGASKVSKLLMVH
jgi:hypothetical protein